MEEHCIKIIYGGKIKKYLLNHLRDLKITLNEFEFDNGLVKPIEIFIRPTNHVYTRALQGDDNISVLKESNSLIIKYEHESHDTYIYKRDMRGNKIISCEKRVFCPKKYHSSLLLPVFVESLQSNFKKTCVLANKGDDKTCLCAHITLPEPYGYNDIYLVFFKLHKVNSQKINMIIETAFIVDKSNYRIDLLGKKNNTKNLFVIIKNVFSGRLPFEGRSIKSSKKKYKKLKNIRKKKK